MSNVESRYSDCSVGDHPAADCDERSVSRVHQRSLKPFLWIFRACEHATVSWSHRRCFNIGSQCQQQHLPWSSSCKLVAPAYSYCIVRVPKASFECGQLTDDYTKESQFLSLWQEMSLGLHSFPHFNRDSQLH